MFLMDSRALLKLDLSNRDDSFLLFLTFLECLAPDLYPLNQPFPHATLTYFLSLKYELIF